MDHMAATRVQWPAPRHFSSPHPSYYSVFFIPFSTFSRAITFLEFQDPDSPCHLRLTLSFSANGGHVSYTMPLLS